MPFIQGSSVKKAKRGSFENKMEDVHRLIQSEYSDTPLNFVATFEDYVLVFNGDGKLRKISYLFNENGDLEIKSDNASRVIRVIEDADIPAHVSGELKSIVEKMMKGDLTQGTRTQVRELAPFVDKGESYWMSDIVANIEESTGDGAEWFKMYDANVERVRTALHGRVREIEGRVQKTNYSKLASTRLSEFKKEMDESIGIIGDVFSSVITMANGLSFDEKQDFLSAVRESLIAESQAVVGLLGKAEKLSGRESDLPLIAKAHDKLADRARKMALVSEYLGMKAQPNDKE